MYERERERDYLERRAETELLLAQQATNPAVVKAHYVMLGHYLNRLYPAAPRSCAG